MIIPADQSDNETKRLLTDIVIELWNAPQEVIKEVESVLEAEIKRLDKEINVKVRK